MKKVLGRQVLLEFYGCARELLDDAGFVETAMLEAARRARATIVQTAFHRFSPQGVSGIVVIAESHLAIHTWPEYGYAAIDIFTCGSRVLPEVACECLIQAFRPRSVSRKDMDRGTFEGAPKASFGGKAHEASAPAG